MDNVTLGGVTYTKLSVLAKRHNYTTDYLGQLCRSGKVEAELVGRAWYANEASLKIHKAERYQDSGETEKINVRRVHETRDEQHSSVIQVKPRLSKRTIRQFDTSSQVVRRDESVSHIRVSYDADETDLAPQLRKPSVTQVASNHTATQLAKPDSPSVRIVSDNHAHSIKIRDESVSGEVADTPKQEEVQEESIKLDISKESQAFNLSFTKLPSVSLRGSVKIRDLESEDYVDSPVETAKTKPPRRVRAKLPHQVRLPIQSASEPATAVPKHKPTSSVVNSGSKGAPVTFSPTSVAAAPVSRAFGSAYAISAVIALAFFSLGIILFTGSVYVVEDQVIASSWYLQLASLREVFELFQSR